MITLATTPSPLIAVSPRWELAITRRWRDWEGPVTAALCQRGDAPEARLPGVQSAHREWLLELLTRGLPMHAIRRLALDDPREARLVLMAKAERYQDKQRRRKPYGTTTRQSL